VECLADSWATPPLADDSQTNTDFSELANGAHDWRENVNRFWKPRLIVIFALLSLACSSAASDIYFAPTSAGSNNGTSCSNAYAYNDATHGWSLSAQQSAGNNLHICSGTYTGAAGATMFSTVNNGTSGSPITLIADQGAATIQCPYCGAANSSTYGINLANNYWTLNGDENLTIQNSLNGDPGATCPGGTCTYEQGTVELIGITGSNVIVENMVQVGPVFVREGPNFHDGGIDSTQAITIPGGSNIHITNSSFTGGYNMVALGVSAQSNIEVDHVTIANCAHCTSMGYTGTGTAVSNIKFHDNHYEGANGLYDDIEGSVNEYHVNAFIIFLDSSVCTSCTITGLQIYNNLCDGLWSKLSLLDACIFMDEQGTNRIPGYQIYNNVYNIQDGAYGGPSGAELISESQTSGNTGSYIVNNTVYQGTADGTCMHVNYPTSLTLENNIFVNCGYQYLDNDTQMSPIYDYNDWYSTIGSGSGWIVSSGTNCTGTGCSFSGWKALGVDTHGKFANPNLNTTSFQLPSGSAAIGAGANLTGLCSTLTALCNGAPQTFGAGGACGSGCLARSSSDAWDVGAYPYSSSSSNPPPVPTSLTAVVH
jgi:hypothetical protein